MLNGFEASFWGDENVMEAGSAEGVLNITELYTDNGLKGEHIVMCTLPQFKKFPFWFLGNRVRDLFTQRLLKTSFKTSII